MLAVKIIFNCALFGCSLVSLIFCTECVLCLVLMLYWIELASGYIGLDAVYGSTYKCYHGLHWISAFGLPLENLLAMWVLFPVFSR